MGHAQDSSADVAASIPSVSSYYEPWPDTGVFRLQVGGRQRFHLGLWGPETKTPEAAWERTIQGLMEGCDLAPGTRILDAGCGMGATAMELAETFGVHVTGVTICEPHVAQATEEAARRGISHLVEFHHADFMDLPFPDASFDIVINQESFCYASDRLAYLRGVYRVLKPNGRWQCIDGFRSDDVLSEEQEEVQARICRGFNMQPPIVRMSEAVEFLAETGFVGTRSRDVGEETVGAIMRIKTMWFLYGHLLPRSEELKKVVDAYLLTLRAGSKGWLSFHLLFGVRPPADA